MSHAMALPGSIKLQLTARAMALPGAVQRLLNDPAAERAVLFHDLVFFLRQRARLEQDGVGDADLAHVVQQGGFFQQFDDLFGHFQFPGDDAHVSSDAANVVGGFVVAVFRRAGQRLHQSAPGSHQFGRYARAPAAPIGPSSWPDGRSGT